MFNMHVYLFKKKGSQKEKISNFGVESTFFSNNKDLIPKINSTRLPPPQGLTAVEGLSH